MGPFQNHYTVLNLPAPSFKSTEQSTSLSLRPEDIKAAYRRALLAYHPDKSSKPASDTRNGKHAAWSVDQITQAYQVLSDPARRREYDAGLRLVTLPTSAGLGTREGGLVGVESIELDQMEVDEAKGTWFRSCRCGDGRGFEITEEDLEKELEERGKDGGQQGEVIVGCKGCSLWLRVGFRVVGEGEDQEVG